MMSEIENFPSQLMLCNKEPADFLALFPARADLILCDTREQLGELDRTEKIAACMPDIERILRPLGHAVIVCEPELKATRTLLSGVEKTNLEGRWLVWDDPTPMGPFTDKSAMLLVLKRPENDARHECLQDGYVFRRCPTYSDLANNLIRIATRRGGLVVDPCTLTAEALISAHELRRHAAGATPCGGFFDALRTSGAFRVLG
jgi:hypothetical protein